MDAQIRRRAIGGTDIAAIVGVSPFASPWDVYARLTGLLDGVTFEGNTRMRWGKLIERAIAEGYTEETGRAHVWCDRTLPHPENPHFCWTPDAEVPTDRGLDCKSISIDQRDKWGDGITEVPEHIAVQAQWYMAAARRPFWDIAALFGGNTLRVYTLQHDPELAGLLEENAERFWVDNVEGRKEPTITATEPARQYLKQKFKTHTDEMIETVIPLIQDYREARDAFKAAEKRKDDLELGVKLCIGDKLGLIGPWGKITLNTVKETEVAAFTRAAYRRIDVRFKK